MLHKNIIICTAVMLAAVTFMMQNGKKECSGAASQLRHIDLTDNLAKLNTISVPKTGITEKEMLRRFGGANALVMEYDKERKTDVTRFYYRIGDSDVFMEFVSSWKQNREIVDFSMKEGYYMLDFMDYGYKPNNSN